MSCWLLRINALHAKRETHEKYLRYAGHAALLVSVRENLDILITEPTASYLARKHWLTFSLATTWCAFPLPPPAYTLHKCSFLLFLFCSAANKHLWQTYSAQQCFAAAGNGCVLSVHLGGVTSGAVVIVTNIQNEPAVQAWIESSKRHATNAVICAYVLQCD